MTTSSMAKTAANAIQPYRERLASANLGPLWDVLSDLVTPQPAPAAVAAMWPYETVRRLLFEAAGEISTEEAERRVLVFENPGLKGRSSITDSLYAGIQLVMPGETARAHRHTQSAIRFVIEGAGGTTTVEGERLDMQPGDLILTPSWLWHDHGNDTSVPMVWLDGLDVPIVSLLQTSFSEIHAEVQQRFIAKPSDYFGLSGLARVNSPSSPRKQGCMRYPYEEARAQLDAMRSHGEGDPHHGVRLRYVEPGTNRWVSPTLGATIQLVPKGLDTLGYQSTDGGIFLVAEGQGEVEIGASRFALKRGDVFVVPPWAIRHFHATEDLVLQGFSSRPAQEAFGLFRECLLQAADARNQ